MGSTPDGPCYEFDGFYLDTLQRRLFDADGREISLSSRAFDALVYLVERRGEVIDKEPLMAAVWPNVVVDENSLNKAISVIRNALGDTPGDHRYIITIPGRGYQFVASVRTLDAKAGAATGTFINNKPTSRITARPLAAVVLVIIVLSALSLYRWLHFDQGNDAAPTLAVLPFIDLSPSQDQEYFADGVAEELLNQLSQIRDLFVVGRTSSFSFKGKNEDLRVIGEKLGVSHILEGSVRKEGDRVRISAQLVKAADGYHLWSRSYDREMNDIFAIQDDLAKSVANALEITLGIGELGRRSGMTHNVTAYEAYLAGRMITSAYNRETTLQLIEHLERAVRLDPDFALAWASLADAYGGPATLFILEQGEEFYSKRDTARARVLALVPESVYALSIQAEQSRNLIEMEHFRQLALAQNPSGFDTNMRYGSFLNRVGRSTEAIKYFQRATQVEPLLPLAHLWLGLAYHYTDNSSAAIEAFKQGQALSDEPIFDRGLLILALEENDRVLIDEKLAPDDPIRSFLDSPEGVEIHLRQLLTDPANSAAFNRGMIAVWASYFGEYELALEIWQELDGREGSAFWRPIHKPMRRLPGFKDLVVKLGFVDYWRASGNWGEFCHPVSEEDFECN